MDEQTKQVFQSISGRRWKAFKGTLRIVATIIILASVALLVDLLSSSGSALPRLKVQNEIYQNIIDPNHIITFNTKSAGQFKKSRDELMQLLARQQEKKQRHHMNGGLNTEIKAGFYVNWDAQSFYSLRDNITRLNMVMPEWFFLQENSDTLFYDVDVRALNFMQSHKVHIVPMISDYFKNKWSPENAQRIFASKERRSRLIESIVRMLNLYKFSGVNMDIEAISSTEKNNMLQFQRELYERLHKLNFIVTQDVPVGDDAYDFKELQQFNDYIVLMAYDLHYAGSNPGAIADIKWVEMSLLEAVKYIPAEKLILGLAAYGYDWPKGKEGEDITYQEALVRARESEADIDFDNDSYNLSYSYDDDNNMPHEVWFTDAASCFNIMRTAADFGCAGVALWRLGGEDPRLWSFFNNNVSADTLKNRGFDLSKLKTIDHSTSLDFEGEGEILDIVSTPQTGHIDIEYDNKEQLITEENYRQLPSSYLIRKFGTASPKQIVLTFDDGPDRKYTPEILDILRKEKVPAAFFMLGINAENNLDLVKQIYDEGHEIGNHSFMHPNLAVVSTQRIKIELNSTRRLIESITGHSTLLFRPPYDADTEPEHIQEILPIIEARNENYLTVGASIDPLDWQAGVSADSIMARIKREESFGAIVLLHDAGGDRSQTVEALPRIIKYFRDKGYTFTTVSSLLGKSRDEVMPALKDRKDVWLSKINWSIAEVVFWLDRFIFALFFIGIFLALARLILVGVFAWMQKRKHWKQNAVGGSKEFKVSIIVPAYNEQIHAVRNVQNLLKSDYTDFEIIFVDDGSKDDTYKTVCEAFSDNERVKVLTKPNGGKPTALNYGIRNASGEIMVCIDADTQLMPDAIRRLTETFSENVNIAAVAGNVKVGNERNVITKWQSIEYITSQNFDRRAFDLLNAITVVPGAIGAFRKSAIIEAGGFTTDTLAEDCDITIRILRLGYTIRYNEKALAYTEAPETIRMFLRQRFRWSFGIMQNLWKHRDCLFNHNYGSLGMVALPNVLLFHFVLPLFSPLAEFMMVLALLGGYWRQLITYYILFLALDFLSAAIAFMFEKEKPGRLWLLLPQRLIYRQLMYWVLIKSIISAVRGTLVGWGILKRTGQVHIQKEPA